jgi:hypothetical protein
MHELQQAYEAVVARRKQFEAEQADLQQQVEASDLADVEGLIFLQTRSLAMPAVIAKAKDAERVAQIHLLTAQIELLRLQNAKAIERHSAALEAQQRAIEEANRIKMAAGIAAQAAEGERRRITSEMTALGAQIAELKKSAPSPGDPESELRAAATIQAGVGALMGEMLGR